LLAGDGDDIQFGGDGRVYVIGGFGQDEIGADTTAAMGAAGE
jgi:hypothetical protein